MCIQNINSTTYIFSDSTKKEGSVFYIDNSQKLYGKLSADKKNAKIDKFVIFSNTSIIDGVDKYISSGDRKGIKFCIRLSKTIGKNTSYYDLAQFEIDFNDNNIIKQNCADFINKFSEIKIENIALPVDQLNNEYALKVLVKEIDSNNNEDDRWTIQSIQMLNLVCK